LKTKALGITEKEEGDSLNQTKSIGNDIYTIRKGFSEDLWLNIEVFVQNPKFSVKPKNRSS